MTKFEKMVAIFAVLLFAYSVVQAGISLNQGFGLPTNGPCTPFVNSAGICSDDGVPSVYGTDGTVVHLPARGPQGVPGNDGKNGIDGLPGKDGINGVDGQQGPAGAQGIQGPPGVIFPANLRVTCPPAPAGNVPKGWTAVCTISLP